MQEDYFDYGEKELSYLKSKDKKLAFVIESIGMIKRKVDSDVFSSIVGSIVAQQISSKAHVSIIQRMEGGLGKITPDSVFSAGKDNLQKFGLSFRKAEYIFELSRKVVDGSIDLAGLEKKDDKEIIDELVKIKGIGVWTAEMLLLFCFQRPNVFSFGDLAILRGIRMVYHHKEISRERFERYRKRFSPYCSVASLYFWAVAGGAIPGLKDLAEKR